jgi:hypothetical protein
MNNLLPQDLQLQNHLQTVGTITAVEAATIYKVRCITSNISRLRKSGMTIGTQFKKDLTGQRYARYSYPVVAS